MGAGTAVNCCISLESIVNSAVLIHSGEESILVDGIFGRTQYFSPLPQDIRRACFGYGEKYRNIEYLLFTHRHEDHFNSGMANAYAVNNRVRKIIVPCRSNDPRSFMEDREGIADAKLKGILYELGEGSENRGNSEGRYRFVLSEDISAEAFRCGHLDPKSFGSVQHYAFLINIRGRQILIAADADISDENAQILSGIVRPDAVLVTPLFYLDPRGRAILKQMKPERILIYHLPYHDDDTSGIRDLALRLAEEHREDQAVKLFEPGRSEMIRN